MTWKELEAQGVKRCNGVYTVRQNDGSKKHGVLCRRRAVEAFGFEWCDKCGPKLKVWEDFNKKVLRESQ